MEHHHLLTPQLLLRRPEGRRDMDVATAARRHRRAGLQDLLLPLQDKSNVFLVFCGETDTRRIDACSSKSD